MIWVSGEALIDLLPTGPVPGGGPANTAIALARLGLDVHFVGGLSTDDYGQMLRRYLEENGVDLSQSLSSDLPTAIAKVELAKDGSASYTFSLATTATFSLDVTHLPVGKPDVLHIGSLATVVEPSASVLLEWASKIDAPIVFDPNIRAAVINDVDLYRSYVTEWAKIATVIKLSDDDLIFLYPELSEVEALRQLMSDRCQLIVLTKGASGIVGMSRDQTIVVPGVAVQVVDTIGAGDTVGAVLVEAIARGTSLQGESLEGVLHRAVQAAAITCSRAGCNPPTAAELEK